MGEELLVGVLQPFLGTAQTVTAYSYVVELNGMRSLRSIGQHFRPLELRPLPNLVVAGEHGVYTEAHEQRRQRPHRHTGLTVTLCAGPHGQP